MPVPGSQVECKSRLCGRLVTVGKDAVPAYQMTGNRRSRGFYCQDCWERLAIMRPVKHGLRR